MVKIGVHVARLSVPITSKIPIVTAQAKHIIKDFESLPDQEKIEVLAEIIRISREIEYPDASDEDLRSAANGVFLEYDRQETT
jgi:hypothetical protein